MSRAFEPELLTEPATLRQRFTATDYVRKAYEGASRRTSFQVGLVGGRVYVWTIGPLGWWHDFQAVPAGTSFDAALALTHIPTFYGWDREGAGA